MKLLNHTCRLKVNLPNQPVSLFLSQSVAVLACWATLFRSTSGPLCKRDEKSQSRATASLVNKSNFRHGRKYRVIWWAPIRMTATIKKNLLFIHYSRVLLLNAPIKKIIRPRILYERCCASEMAFRMHSTWKCLWTSISFSFRVLYLAWAGHIAHPLFLPGGAGPSWAVHGPLKLTARRFP